ncbi:MAG: thioesterase family protein [Planctomycetota bacterium]
MAQSREKQNDGSEVSRVFSYFGTVRFDDTDANVHVNNGRYNAYCDEAALQVFAAGGIRVENANGMTIGAITRRAEYEYLGQLKYPDRFRVDSTIEFPKPTRIVFRHSIFQADSEVCVCRCVAHGLWLDFKTGRPHRLSEDERVSILRGSL